MTNKESGWKPEPFDRAKLTMEDVDELLVELRQRAEDHFRDYGNGIFMHPHEIVGCMFGQQMKLSTAADASIYDGDYTEFRERCMKTLFAIVVGTMSVDRLTELKEDTDD